VAVHATAVTLREASISTRRGVALAGPPTLALRARPALVSDFRSPQHTKMGTRATNLETERPIRASLPGSAAAAAWRASSSAGWAATGRVSQAQPMSCTRVGPAADTHETQEETYRVAHMSIVAKGPDTAIRHCLP
jgi:hypothetical protein